MIWLISGLGIVLTVLVLSWPRIRRWLEDSGRMMPALPKRDSKAMGQATANAMAHFEILFNPAIEHVIEMRRGGDLKIEQSGRLDDPEIPPAEDFE